MASDPSSSQQDSLRLAALERVYDLMSAALSLVAALAWNDAIQSLFQRFFGGANSLYAKFSYALILTLVIVFVTQRLTRVTKALKQRLQKEGK